MTDLIKFFKGMWASGFWNMLLWLIMFIVSAIVFGATLAIFTL